MQYYKLRKQPESQKKKVEYYCDWDGNIYSKLLSTGEFKMIIPNINNKGYLDISQLKHYLVHRAVWEAIFGPIPEDLTVDHIDSNKLNNKITNLQLLSRRDNVKKANDVSVDMLDLEGKFIKTFLSQMDAMRWLRLNGYLKASVGPIWAACNGRYKQAYGFKWRYHTDG